MFGYPRDRIDQETLLPTYPDLPSEEKKAAFEMTQIGEDLLDILHNCLLGTHQRFDRRSAATLKADLGQLPCDHQYPCMTKACQSLCSPFTFSLITHA